MKELAFLLLGLTVVAIVVTVLVASIIDQRRRSSGHAYRKLTRAPLE